ncbi:MAG: HupE/UreJ family protein [Rhodospirillaceae bacterium]
MTTVRTAPAALASLLLVAGWSLPALAGDVALGSGAFGTGFGLPLLHLAALLGFAGIGLWSGLLGGETVWQFPAIALFGAFAGCLIGEAGVTLPFAELAPMVGLVVIGGSIVLGLNFPLLSPAVLVLVLALYLGLPLAHALRGPHLWYWLGYGSGALLAVSGGLGHAVVVGRAPLALGVRTLGAGLAATGILMVLDHI